MKVNNKTVEFKNRKILNFDFPIMKTLAHNGVFIIMLDIPPKIFFNENVFGVNIDGCLLWQIPVVFDLAEQCPFIDMHIDDENKLILRNWCHLNCEINSRTGEILSTEGYGW